MNADQARRKQMLHNAKRLAHKIAIHRRPKGITVRFKEPVQIIDLDKKAKPVLKEKPGAVKRLWSRMTGGS